MLNEQDRQLLAAYVDGEPSARQRKTVLRLLRKSPEARSLLREMQDDARQLRHLPRRQSAPEFQYRILQAFVDWQAEPAPAPLPASPPAPVTIPLWLGLIIAGAIVLSVGVGSFLYFLR